MDTDLTAPLTGAKSVSATFENLSEFANTELPKKFSKTFTDQVMNPEFQAQYSELYKAAENAGTFEGKGNWKPKRFKNYLKSKDLKPRDVKLMTQRFEMHSAIGNNDDYLGNSLTKNNNTSIDQQYGVVETINIERQNTNLAQLDEINAIKIIPGLKTI